MRCGVTAVTERRLRTQIAEERAQLAEAVGSLRGELGRTGKRVAGAVAVGTVLRVALKLFRRRG